MFDFDGSPKLRENPFEPRLLKMGTRVVRIIGPRATRLRWLARWFYWAVEIVSDALFVPEPPRAVVEGTYMLADRKLLSIASKPLAPGHGFAMALEVPGGVDIEVSPPITVN